MADRFSAEWVREQFEDKGRHRLEHHDCSMCGYPTAYRYEEGRLFFDAGCDCTGRYAYRDATFEDIADWFRMQSNDEIRERIAQGFRPIEEEDGGDDA